MRHDTLFEGLHSWQEMCSQINKSELILDICQTKARTGEFVYSSQTLFAHGRNLLAQGQQIAVSAPFGWWACSQ